MTLSLGSSQTLTYKKPQNPPLVLVKAVKKTAEQKGGCITGYSTTVTDFKAKLNTKSVQEWFIDIIQTRRY